MARFQALTNSVLEEELEMLRERLGLDPRQKAELLREVSALAAWVVRQAEQGREIEARHGQRSRHWHTLPSSVSGPRALGRLANA